MLLQRIPSEMLKSHSKNYTLCKRTEIHYGCRNVEMKMGSGSAKNAKLNLLDKMLLVHMQQW